MHTAYHINSLLSKYCHLWLQKNKTNKQKKCFEVLNFGSHSEYVNILYTVNVIERDTTQRRQGMIMQFNFICISINRLNN